jgi:hypothetical protein
MLWWVREGFTVGEGEEEEKSVECASDADFRVFMILMIIFLYVMI